MKGTQPFMLVRARVNPAYLGEFRRWYQAVHLPHALAIPGITGYRALTPGLKAAPGSPNVLAVFHFQDASVIQKALSSPEAQAARQDWVAWAQHVRDLSIQIYAVMDARMTLRHLN